jgi:hypothetical protein
MCCLGIAAQQLCGFTDADLVSVATLRGLAGHQESVQERLREGLGWEVERVPCEAEPSHQVTKDPFSPLYEINDRSNYSDEERVAKLNVEAERQQLPFRFELEALPKEAA